jgi:uncharacterized protein
MNPLELPLRYNRYATVVETRRSLYVVVADRGTLLHLDRGLYDEEALRSVKEERVDALPPALRRDLWLAGVLVPLSYDEQRAAISVLRQAEAADEARAQASSMHLFLTHNCNFRCTYCIQGHDIKRAAPEILSKRNVELAFEAADAILGRLPRRARLRRVVLFGGEPLLPASREPVEAAVRLAAARGLGITVGTNGYHYGSFHDLFAPLCKEGGVRFLVSLDGPPEVHDRRRPLANGRGTFAEVASAVTQMLEAGASVTLQPIVDSGNADALGELYSICEARGWVNHPGFSMKCGITMYPYAGAFADDRAMTEEPLVVERLVQISKKSRGRIDPGLDVELKPSHFLDKILRQQEPVAVNTGCSATKAASLSFSPDGHVYPCREIAGRGAAHAIARYAPSLEIIEERFASWYGGDLARHPKCAGCKHLLLCGGGCRVATESNGRPLSDPLCPDFEGTWRVYLEQHEAGRSIEQGDRER